MSAHPEPPAQPTAPYLEAVTAYGFRGSTRFHIPGHKGGEGADPGLRAALSDRALLLADCAAASACRTAEQGGVKCA